MGPEGILQEPTLAKVVPSFHRRKKAGNGTLQGRPATDATQESPLPAQIFSIRLPPDTKIFSQSNAEWHFICVLTSFFIVIVLIRNKYHKVNSCGEETYFSSFCSPPPSLPNRVS
jgi:hypothetical protein